MVGTDACPCPLHTLPLKPSMCWPLGGLPLVCTGPGHLGSAHRPAWGHMRTCVHLSEVAQGCCTCWVCG